MARNLESRIELMIPIENEIIINNLLRMLNTQLKDNVLAKELSSNGEYYKVIQEKQDEPINSQLEEEKNTTRISRKLHKQTSSIKTRKHI